MSIWGQVVGMAVRQGPHGPMRLISHDDAKVGEGLSGEPGRSGARGLTFLSRASWRDACAQLGTAVPWEMRRANILVEGVDLQALIGRTVRVGDAVVHIRGETRPCALMDATQTGLRSALVPDCRGGVHGEVIAAGRISVGDALEVTTADA